MANDPTYLSARQFAEHLVKDRGWHRIQPQQVKKYCRSGQISRAQLVDEKIWVIPRGRK